MARQKFHVRRNAQLPRGAVSTSTEVAHLSLPWLVLKTLESTLEKTALEANLNGIRKA